MERGRDDQSGEREEDQLQVDEDEDSKASKWPWMRSDHSLTPSLSLSLSHSQSQSQTLHRFIIHPHNCKYRIWMHFILIWAVYSSFFTPLEFGFFRGLPENLFLLDIAGQFAFLIDIALHFFVAFNDTHSNRIVHTPNLIAKRYLKSRFSVDLLGCFPWDAIYKACGKKEAIRYLLWIRLSRALRVTEYFEKLEKDTRINYIVTRIVKLLVVELYCTHTAACIFYYLATTIPISQEGYTWIGSLKMGDYTYSHFRDIDFWKRYVTSLYFAIVTMATVGYGDIHAVNVREMIFIMVYVSFDMILGAYLLGNMTALIVKGSNTERFRDKMDDVNKYVNRNNLGKHISNEIKYHLQLQCDSSYAEIAVLQDIPASIRAKISQKLYEPYIKEVLLFKGCSNEFIKQIATRVHEEFFLPGEVIIEQGKVVDQLYIVCLGELEEIGREEDDHVENSGLQLYSSFGEVSVLCNTPHPYTVRVRQLCRLLRLDKQSFTDTLEIYFSDGRVILNNLLEGKDSARRNKILESDIVLIIGKHESELAMRVNCAAYDGDYYRLKRLIGAGADPNKTDYDGRSPLHIAASKGYEDITLFLLQLEVCVNISDKFKNTPLFEAVNNGHDEIAALLVKAGALLSISDAGGFLCMIVFKRDIDLLRRVLANGIDPNAKNYDLRTPLHIAASEGLCTMANLLLDAGASVLSKDRWGNSPLDEARLAGYKNLIKLLEVSRTAQLSDCSEVGMRRRKCQVFPFHPLDVNEERRQGVALWVPQSIEELMEEAMEQLKCANSSHIILSETSVRITDADMITNDQKLFLVRE